MGQVLEVGGGVEFLLREKDTKGIKEVETFMLNYGHFIIIIETPRISMNLKLTNFQQKVDKVSTTWLLIRRRGSTDPDSFL